MTINPYFQNGKGPGSSSEKDLVEKNIIESIQINGLEVYYIPRTEVSADFFYKEDPNSKFENFYPIEMYMKDPTNYLGQGDLFTNFGMEFTQKLEFIVSKFRFQEELQKPRPEEGDLLYLPQQRIIFQLDSCEDEPVENFYNLSGLYTFTLKCSIFTFSHEEFDTGINRVDQDLNKDTQDRNKDQSIPIHNEGKDYLDFTEENLFGEIASPNDKFPDED